MKCFYHNDLDGQAAAFVVWHKKITDMSNHDGGEYVAVNYDKPFPAGTIARGEEVWIVDFSIPPDELMRLLDTTTNITWIDHHKTAIDKYTDFPVDVAGIRRDGTAGCVLTWEYCFPGVAVPRAIELVGDRDVWAWKFGQETADFCAGLMMLNTEPQSMAWTTLLRDTHQFQRVTDQGATVNGYRARFYAEMVEAIGFEAVLDGYKILCLNAARVDSKSFGEAIHEYDAVSSCYWNGKQWTVSLYSEKIDVSEIAKARGGGGHRGASGFQCAELPYELVG